MITQEEKTAEAKALVSAIEDLIDARIEMLVPAACGFGQLSQEAYNARVKLISLLGGVDDE